jgi:voltage-gated potassium channel
LADGIYWSLTTMTTVGNNLPPQTSEGKILAVIVVFVGIAFVAILTGALAQRFVSEEVDAEVEEVEEDLDETTRELLAELRGVRERLGRLEAAVARRR